mmetsp:Transcript_98504/g.248705  ORF Transcript_98504/g.248705 Transcript_98504/m.248705 type:complete len:292 (+) Transcript_98504:326-1201(+)
MSVPSPDNVHLAERLDHGLRGLVKFPTQVVPHAGGGEADGALRAHVVPKASAVLDLLGHLSTHGTIHLRCRALRDALVHPPEEDAFVKQGAARVLLLRQPSLDDARVHRATQNPRGPATVLEFPAMEEAHCLRDTVLSGASVGLLGRGDELVQIYVLDEHTSHRAQDNDAHVCPTLPRLAELRQQQLYHQEMRQVVCGELCLETLLRGAEFHRRHDASIVDEVMQGQAQVQELLHKRFDRGEVVEVHAQDCGLPAQLLPLPHLLQEPLRFRRTAHCEDDVAAVLHHHSGLL